MLVFRGVLPNPEEDEDLGAGSDHAGGCGGGSWLEDARLGWEGMLNEYEGA